MTDSAETSVKFWKNKKSRNIVILVILLIVAFFCLKSCYNKVYQNREAKPGSTRTYICPKCEYTGKMMTVNVTEIQCPKCSTRVGFAWKCRKCEREFAVKPTKVKRLMSKEDLIAKKQSEAQCTNCSSFETYPLAK